MCDVQEDPRNPYAHEPHSGFDLCFVAGRLHEFRIPAKGMWNGWFDNVVEHNDSVLLHNFDEAIRFIKTSFAAATTSQLAALPPTHCLLGKGNISGGATMMIRTTNQFCGCMWQRLNHHLFRREPEIPVLFVSRDGGTVMYDKALIEGNTSHNDINLLTVEEFETLAKKCEAILMKLLSKQGQPLVMLFDVRDCDGRLAEYMLHYFMKRYIVISVFVVDMDREYALAARMSTVERLRPLVMQDMVCELGPLPKGFPLSVPRTADWEDRRDMGAAAEMLKRLLSG